MSEKARTRTMGILLAILVLCMLFGCQRSVCPRSDSGRALPGADKFIDSCPRSEPAAGAPDIPSQEKDSS